MPPQINAYAMAFPTGLPPARWIDIVVLAANTAKNYAIPTDASGSRATMLRFAGTANKPNTTANLYYNCYGTATAPGGADVLDGSASPEMVGPEFWLAVPSDVVQISLLSDQAGSMTIEAWGLGKLSR